MSMDVGLAVRAWICFRPFPRNGRASAVLYGSLMSILVRILLTARSCKQNMIVVTESVISWDIMAVEPLAIGEDAVAAASETVKRRCSA